MKKKILLMGFFLTFLLTGCKGKMEDKLPDSDRAKITLSTDLPEENFNDTLYLHFQDIKDQKNMFWLTLSQDNQYLITFSVPTGKYKLDSCQSASGKDYVSDIDLLEVKADQEITTKISDGVLPTVKDDPSVKTSNFVFGWVIGIVMVVVLFVGLFFILKKRKNHFMY